MRTLSPMVCLAVALIATTITVHPAQAQLPTYTTLHSFAGSDGAKPSGNLIRDPAGNLYGTTRAGGDKNAGTVFKLDASGNWTTLHSFDLQSGAAPFAGLVADAAGNLYGTASGGGSQACVGGCGVIFEVDASGLFTVLYTFSGGSDGATPLGSLLRDHSGNLYGTTRYGGTLDKGTIFKLQPDGTLTILHRFTGFPDGESPFAGLVADSAGNLYGTTYFGGGAFNYGTVFKLDRSGNETVLYRFTGGDNGSNPNAGLILDDAGNLYGATLLGGSGGGIIFVLNPAGTMTVLHRFVLLEGLEPAGTLVRDPAGNLYGTTYLGGTENQGTVFRLEQNLRLRVLHNFLGGQGQGKPYAGLIRDNTGNLYGAATRGGADNFGSVFKLSF